LRTSVTLGECKHLRNSEVWLKIRLWLTDV
jgi:hypothetical protein